MSKQFPGKLIFHKRFPDALALNEGGKMSLHCALEHIKEQQGGKNKFKANHYPI